VPRRTTRSRRDGPDLSGESGLRDAWLAHAGELYGYAQRCLGDSHAAEEAVQETFLRAWRAADRYDQSRPLRPWLFAILRHVVVDETRSRAGRAGPRRDEPPDTVTGGTDPLDSSVDGLLVSEALRRLRPDHRTVLVETYYRGRSYAEVSRQLGIPEGTARSRAFYALRAMRLALEEMGWEG
jgi:RNA polymerase sigma-70 factor, ECF subfamily